MGIPEHYSLDIPLRCRDLVDRLEDKVMADEVLTARWGGPVRTTFLLAMATPMIVLPIERIFKPVVLNRGGVADDTELDPGLSDRVASALGKGRLFGEAGFVVEGAWSYRDLIPAFNVAAEWPEHILEELSSEEAVARARAAEASEILLVLRNALSHGGVTYLDSDGRNTRSAASMIAFVGRARGGSTDLRVARVGVDDFRKFLSAWADWLDGAGVVAQLNAQEPGYLLEAAE